MKLRIGEWVISPKGRYGRIVSFYDGGENGLEYFEVAVLFPNDMVFGFPIILVFEDHEITRR